MLGSRPLLEAAEKVTFRDQDAVRRFFDGLEFVEPEMVQASKWRPATEEEANRPAALWAGVALKRRQVRLSSTSRRSPQTTDFGLSEIRLSDKRLSGLRLSGDDRVPDRPVVWALRVPGWH